MSLQARFKKPKINTPSAVTPFIGPRLLTLKEAAQYIGHSVDLVRAMVSDGVLPHVPKGRGDMRKHVLVDRVDLDSWIQKNKVGRAA